MEKTNKPIRLFNIYGDNRGTGFAGNVWDINGVSPTLTTMGGGNREPMIVINANNNDMKQKDMCMKEKKADNVIIYDDYNSNIPSCQDVIGTLTTQFGNPAPRHGCKIIELETDMTEQQKSNSEVMQVGNIMQEKNFANPQCGRIYSTKGLSPTINTCGGGQREPKIVVKETMKLKTIIGSKQEHAYRASIDAISPTLTEAMGMGGGQIPLLTDATVEETKTNNFMEQARLQLPKELEGKKFRIRKLTPRECFRLMGVDDKDIDKMQAAGVSNSGQYKLAGNSIVVDVLFHLFRKMFIETNQDVTNEPTQLHLF